MIIQWSSNGVVSCDGDDDFYIGPTYGIEWLPDEGRWRYTIDGVEVERVADDGEND